MSIADINLFLNTNRKAYMRLRLNQEYRNKIGNRMRVHIEAEDTQEKEKYFVARERKVFSSKRKYETLTR